MDTPDTPGSNAKHQSCQATECFNPLRTVYLRKIEVDPTISSSARGAKPLEVIGTYNPIPKRPTNLYDENAEARPYKEIALDRSRAKYWLGVGAQPSDPVWKLMGMVSQTLVFFIRESLGIGGSKENGRLLSGLRFQQIIWADRDYVVIIRTMFTNS